MLVFFINFIQLLIYFFSLFFIINLVKTRVYVYLILNFFCYIIYIAFIFYYLNLEVIAFLLILVYAGAVVILFTFVVMLYENHKLLFIPSSYGVMVFLFFLSSLFFFFLFNGQRAMFLKERTFWDDLTERELDYLKKKYSEEELALLTEEEVKKEVSLFRTLDRSSTHLSDFIFDEGNIAKNIDSKLIFYNFIDNGFIERNLRIPYYIYQDHRDCNIVLKNNMDFYNLNVTDTIFFMNRPVRFLNNDGDDFHIVDLNFFELMDLYSCFLYDDPFIFHVDLGSLLCYTKHDVSYFESQDYYKSVNDNWGPVEYFNVIKPQRMVDVNGIIAYEDYLNYEDFWLDYAGLINRLYCFWFGIDLSDITHNFGHVYKAFDDIALYNTYTSMFESFNYFFLTSNNLFNTIGIYLYSNCLFEFMIIGMMLFICLITIMRLLKCN